MLFSCFPYTIFFQIKFYFVFNIITLGRYSTDSLNIFLYFNESEKRLSKGIIRRQSKLKLLSGLNLKINFNFLDPLREMFPLTFHLWNKLCTKHFLNAL